MPRGHVDHSTADDTQAIFGLGVDESDVIEAAEVSQAELDVVQAIADDHIADTAAAHAASAVSVDSTSVFGTEVDVQGVLEDITTEFATPTHTHGAGGIWDVEVELAADQSLTTSLANVASFATGTVVDNDIVEFEVVAYMAGANNGDTVEIGFATGVDAGIVYEDEGIITGGVGTSVVGDHSTAYAIAVGTADTAVFRAIGRLVANGTGGFIVQVRNQTGARGALKKGSYFRAKFHAA